MEKIKKRNTLKWWGAFLLAISIIVFIMLPIPYYLEVPGSAEKLNTFVTVDGKKDENPGAFMLTTVGIRQATPLQAVLSKTNNFTTLLSKKELLGDATSQEYDAMQQLYMSSSQNNATKVALDLAKIPYEMKFNGIYVLAVQEESNFYGKLQIGDVVTKIDGQTFENTEEFMAYVKSKAVSATVTITYERNKEEKEVSGKLIELATDHKAGIGIQLTDHSELVTEPDIKIDAGSIGGPSAGLMFTLETYSLLSHEDLRKGHLIAGTGTMASDGTVGRIGGIDKKIVAADSEGAEIFFAPDDEITSDMKKEYPDLKSNYEEAQAAGKKIKTKMKIIPVKTVQDALDYLKTLEEKK